MNYKIYTDGSYRSSKKQMGIGVVWIKDENKVFEFSKTLHDGTNNIAELLAIYIALKSIKKNINSLEIISDSEYSIGVLTKNWKPLKNKKLIGIIKQLITKTQNLVKNPIKFTHVKGHSNQKDLNSIYNNQADILAEEASNMLLL